MLSPNKPRVLTHFTQLMGAHGVESRRSVPQARR